MYVITRARLVAFWQEYTNAKVPLLGWYKIISTAQIENFAELRQIFPSADQVSNLTVFNIGGNKFRLIAFIDYNYQKVFIRAVLTHAEYDKDDWKNDEWFE